MIGALRLRCCRDRLRSCNPDTPEANSRHAADHEFSKRAARDVRSVEPILRRLLVPVGEACAICHLSRPSSETCWVLVIGTQRKTKDRERCRRAGGGKRGVSGGRAGAYLGHDGLGFGAPRGCPAPPRADADRPDLTSCYRGVRQSLESRSVTCPSRKSYPRVAMKQSREKLAPR